MRGGVDGRSYGARGAQGAEAGTRGGNENAQEVPGGGGRAESSKGFLDAPAAPTGRECSCVR